MRSLLYFTIALVAAVLPPGDAYAGDEEVSDVIQSVMEESQSIDYDDDSDICDDDTVDTDIEYARIFLFPSGEEVESSAPDRLTLKKGNAGQVAGFHGIIDEDEQMAGFHGMPKDERIAGFHGFQKDDTECLAGFHGVIGKDLMIAGFHGITFGEFLAGFHGIAGFHGLDSHEWIAGFHGIAKDERYAGFHGILQRTRLV